MYTLEGQRHEPIQESWAFVQYLRISQWEEMPTHEQSYG